MRLIDRLIDWLIVGVRQQRLPSQGALSEVQFPNQGAQVISRQEMARTTSWSARCKSTCLPTPWTTGAGRVLGWPSG